MIVTRFAIGMFSPALILHVTAALGQGFPNKPIRIVTGPAGGGSDFIARLIAVNVSPSLGQQMIVDNRTTITANETVARGAPDGYTLLMGGSSLWVAPLLQKMSYDPVKDFAPVIMTDRAINVLIVYPPLQVNSVKDLVALAKAKPGQLNYAAGQLGTTAHLAGELFKSMAGVNIVGVPYKGSAANVSAVISGEVQMGFAQPTVIAPHIKSGKLKALAVASATPSAQLPGMPTVAETLPGFDSVQSQAIFAPAKTPVAIIHKLNQEIARYLKSPEARERVLVTGSEAVGSTPEQLASAIKSETTRLSKLIKDAGIKLEQ